MTGIVRESTREIAARSAARSAAGSARGITTGNAIRRGSLTVETACVMPVILLAVMGALYLSFYVHNRAWLTAAAYEAALSGSMEGIWENGQVYETAQDKGRELGNYGFFGAEGLRIQTTAGNEVQVQYDLDTIPGFGGFSWHLRTQGSAAVIRPVGWIRRIRAAADVLGKLGGS